MHPLYKTFLDSPLGTLEIIGAAAGILAVQFIDTASESPESIPPCLEECRAQFAAYFRGVHREFTIPLLLPGTDFQIAVWNRVRGIPFGQTSAYGENARSLGRPSSARAVGHANARNPIPIVIPCHRVVGGDGGLTGYAGGLWRKHWLLEHERLNC